MTYIARNGSYPRTSSPRIERAQIFLALGGMIWTGFLLLGTSFLWWIAGNLGYSILALIAWRELRKNWRRGRILGATAGVVFLATNGPAAFFACNLGGVCALVVTIMVIVTVLQATVVLMA